MEAIGAAGQEPATTELVTGAVGSTCANCQTPMASDQRYCVSCGERRGKPRFAVSQLTAPTPALAAAGGPGERHPRYRPRMSSAGTLVAGVATLLIAMGVGVLIGHYSNGTPQRSSSPFQVVTVGGGSGSTNATSPAGSTQRPTAAKAGKRPKTVVVHLTPKVLQKASGAASKVFGSSGNLSKNATQKVGGSCSGGAGCQGGKFTGNFFSGG